MARAKKNENTQGQAATAAVQTPAEQAAPRGRVSKNPAIRVTGQLFNGDQFIKAIDCEVTAENFAKATMYLNWTIKHLGLRADFMDPLAPPAGNGTANGK